MFRFKIVCSLVFFNTAHRACYQSEVVVSYLPLNRLERLEWNNIFYILTTKIAVDWLSKANGFRAIPSCLKILEEEEVFKQ